MIKTIALSSGINKVDFDPDEKSPYFYTSNEYVWIKNLSADTVYVSLSEDCGNGVDGTAAIAPYDAYMLILDSRNAFYAAGSGSIEVHTSDISTCPFKISQKGGDISAEGDSVQLGGLQGGVPFSEVTVKGRNMLSYPYSDGTDKTLNGITYIDNGDGTITAGGTATADSAFYFINHADVALTNDRYFLSGCPAGGTGNTYDIVLATFDENNTTIDAYNDTGTGRQIVITEGAKYVSVYIRIRSGVTVDKLVFKPMLELGNTATEYVLPIIGQELTITVNDTDYTITPDSNPYTVPTEIYQQDGINTVYVTGEGEPTLSVKGVKTNAAVKRIWDKLNELTTAIIVSNGEI